MNRLLAALLLCAACNTPTPPPSAKEPGAAGDLRVQVQRLEHAQAEDVAKVLREALVTRPASGGGFKVAVDPDHNAVILSGTTDQIQEALKVVTQLDARPGR